MPPTPRLSPQQSVRRGLRVDDGILQFDFKPSIGISARNIDKLGMDIRSFREPLKRVVQRVMAPSFRKNFDEGGRPESWEPLSEATLAIRDREGFGTAPLIKTGLLRKTIQQLNIWTITTETATIRSLPEKIAYGNIHQGGYEGAGTGRKMSGYMKQAGGDAREAQKLLDDDLIMAMRGGAGAIKRLRGPRHANAIPARPYVLIQDDDYDAIEEIFVEWLQERMLRSGFRRG